MIVGKIAIPDSVLLKKGPLTEAEWTIMRTHTTKGEDICRGIKCLNPVLPIIRSHHERWNGSGIPGWLGRYMTSPYWRACCNSPTFTMR